ncbi:hypothetical protein VTK73DRAFT_5749 [Phialemonium thermophilum]|uniref:Uncharacterized protein n=1 Tax=Phialemonium thermophilum TaxID=223376 RepID=A0ABR3V0P0_9PEZI
MAREVIGEDTASYCAVTITCFLTKYDTPVLLRTVVSSRHTCLGEHDDCCGPTPATRSFPLYEIYSRFTNHSNIQALKTSCRVTKYLELSYQSFLVFCTSCS